MVRNSSEGVIGISLKNPHYYSFHGKEILLITSAEHYGAVINKKFDYKRYLDALARYGLNYTRIYPGAVVLIEGLRRKNDTLAPGENLIAPWARSNVPGYIGGGCKFNLNEWDREYFNRLDDFLQYACEKDIVVEICFFNSQHENTYPYSPLHQDANVQGVGAPTNVEFQTLSDEKLVREQLRFIEKIMTETNRFDNIIYEFVDEPTLDGTKNIDAYRWISALADHAINVESKLPKKHLLAQQVMVGLDFSDDDRISVNVSQYVTVSGRQIGGTPALNNCYGTNKPVEMNETVSVLSDPAYYEQDVFAASRLEAWEFMVGGGAGFNQLNGCFTAVNPAGDDPANHRLLSGLRNLRSFMESMDYVKMTRDNRTVRAMSVGGSVNGISEIGKQYAFYIHHCFLNLSKWRLTHYVPIKGIYRNVITVQLERGEYLVKFTNPEDLTVITSRAITSDGNDMDIICPKYELDLAIQIFRTV